MALPPRHNKLCGRRHYYKCLTRVGIGTVFSLWMVAIWYGTSYSDYQDPDTPGSDRYPSLHPRKQDGKDYDAKLLYTPGEQNAWESVAANRQFDYLHGANGVRENNLTFFKNAEKFREVTPYPEEFTVEDEDLSNKKGGRLKDYVEFTWRLDTPWAAKRKAILPGHRQDPPRLGERGLPVSINPSTLNRQDRVGYLEGWDTHKFNEFASRKISVQRDVPDFRPKECGQRYGGTTGSGSLSRASIIICFYNEAWSVLMRTVHSILLRSPAQLVGEIILVDDFSDHDDLQRPLERFVRETDKLRLIRMKSRSGLVRARLAGVDAAIEPVLIFLDSHVECGQGWLQPLLSTISHNPTVGVTPQIDVINDRTFGINNANPNIGVLEFKSFSFDWGSILPRIQKTIHSPTDAFQSPTMAGGLFAIRKDFFLHLGTYDPHLALWGGENIELSLKLWMCGGGILTHPCSRVAHIFRESSPYLTGDLSQVAVINAARVAFVWTDEYKKFYFQNKHFSNEDWEKIRNNIEERKDLRRDLNCRSFKWFLDNVYPELHIKGSGKYHGPIMSPERRCIYEDPRGVKGRLSMTICDEANRWELTRINEIRSRKKCLTVEEGEDEEEGDGLSLSECNYLNNTQLFYYNIKLHKILHGHTGRCVTRGRDRQTVSLAACDQLSSHQTWYWRRNKDYIP